LLGDLPGETDVGVLDRCDHASASVPEQGDRKER